MTQTIELGQNADGTALMLKALEDIRADISKLKAERATATEAEKVAIDARWKKLDDRVEAIESGIAKQRLFHLPGLDGKELGKVSFARIMLACQNPGLLNTKEYGPEREIYEAMQKRFEGMDAEYRTAINAATGAGGAFLIPTTLQNELIPVLRERSIARQLGVTFLDNLTPGVHSWAKAKAGISVAYLNTEEEVAGAESVATFDLLQLTPRPYAGFVPITFQMQNQTNQTLETWVRGELATIMALHEDKNIFVGTGTAGAPRGVLLHPSIQFVTFASADFLGADQNITDLLFDMVRKTRDKFALGLTGLGWVGAPAAYFKLAKSKDSTGRLLFPSLTDGAVATVSTPTTILRYPAFDSDQIKTGTDSAERFAFGPWGSVMVGHWGTMAFGMSDQTETNWRKARITVRVIWQHDVGVFYGDTFVHAGSDAVTPNFPAN